MRVLKNGYAQNSTDVIFWKLSLSLIRLHINIFQRKRLGVLTWNLMVHFQQRGNSRRMWFSTSSITKISQSTNYLKVLKFKILKCLSTRLLGRFAPIFHFLCEHVLFCVHLKTEEKNFANLKKKKNRGFSRLKKCLQK